LEAAAAACRVLVWKTSAAFHPGSSKVHKISALSSGKKEMKVLPPSFFCKTDTNPNLLFHLAYRDELKYK